MYDGREIQSELEKPMSRTVVRCICAIGQSGQLGLDGHMPWEGHQGPEYQADVARFFQMTKGHVLLAGPRTFNSVPGFAFNDRTVEIIRSSMRPQDVIARFPGRIVFIGGGPAVWDAYAPFIEHWDINRLPYDGPADRWFNPQWLTQSHPYALR